MKDCTSKNIWAAQIDLKALIKIIKAGEKSSWVVKSVRLTKRWGKGTNNKLYCVNSVCVCTMFISKFAQSNLFFYSDSGKGNAVLQQKVIR